MSNNNVNQKQLNKHGFDVQMEFSFKKLGVFMKQIFESAKQNKLIFFVVCFFTMLDALISTFLPVFATMMISGIANDVAETPKQTLTFLAWEVSLIDWQTWFYITLVTLVLLFISDYIVNWSIAQFSLLVEINQRQKMLIRLAQQDVDFFFDHVSGNILTRLVGDTQSLAFGIQQFFTNMIYFLTGIIMSVTIMLLSGIWYVAVIMAVYLIFSIGIAVLIFIQNRRKLITAFDRKREVDQDMTDRISNISLIKSSGLEEYEVKRVEDLNEIYNRAGDKAVRWSAFLTQWIQVTASAMMPLFVIIFCVAFLKNGNLELLIVKMPLAQVLVSFVVGAIAMLIPTLRSATRAQNAAQRISELTDPEPTIKSNPNGPVIEKINSITFEDVVFAYPKKPEKTILPKMNITFEKGKSYAFVGETGSGKSTIAKLLLRFYMPVDGKIMVDGKYKNEETLEKDSHDLNTINLPSYLNKVGYVEQEPQILFGDFFENVRYAKFDATDEEIMRACKKANLHDFIVSLKDGYNTILGQRGFLLSGGQKQRLVIARVFLKNPDFLILDEATSALDNIVEKEIQAELDKLMKGRTSVTIAHRLSTIKNVDQIIVLGANGKGIVQQGTYDELISTPGRFKKLYEAGLMN